MALAQVTPIRPPEEREVLEFDDGAVKAYAPVPPDTLWRIRWREGGRPRDTTAVSRDDAVAKATARAARLRRQAAGRTVGDVAELAAWFTAMTRTTRKRRTGGMRSPTTAHGYELTLNLFVELARYREGDPRLRPLCLTPGAPMRCDDPEHGIGPADLIGLVDERAGINLRTRAANERALRRWEHARAKEQAPRRGGRPPKPAGPRPEPRPEIAGARTIEEFARAVKSMLVEAHRRGRVPYQPWTAEVDDAVVRAQAPHYTTKSVLSREQVWRAAAAVAAIERVSWQAGRQRRVNSGGRYEAVVALAGRKGLRPEETVALRRSWLELDRARPRIALHNAEVYHPLPGGGRVRAVVPLKHRAEGEVRYVYLDEADDDDRLLDLLRRHLESYVAERDGASSDEARRDPYVFTTFSGRPIDLSNWTRAWWQPAARAALIRPGEAALALSPFRLLRAAAITSWLQDGRSLDYCARTAGNSQAVIEKHYKGVLDEVGCDTMRPNQPLEAGTFRRRGGDFEGLDMQSLPSERLLEIQRELGDELGRRLKTG